MTPDPLRGKSTSALWNDGWRCPNCGIEFTPANAVVWGMKDGPDWASPKANPLTCGECKAAPRCKPIGDDFTYDGDTGIRRYTDGRVVDEAEWWATHA